MALEFASSETYTGQQAKVRFRIDSTTYNIRVVADVSVDLDRRYMVEADHL